MKINFSAYYNISKFACFFLLIEREWVHTEKKMKVCVNSLKENPKITLKKEWIPLREQNEIWIGGVGRVSLFYILIQMFGRETRREATE